MAYSDRYGPVALAHRGGGRLAPENTLAAFAISTGLGLRHLETDVRLTADGHLICFHDATLDRTTTGRGPVGARTRRELARFRVEGREPIVGLEEALEAFPDTCFSIDLKEPAAFAPLVRVLRRRGVADRVCVAGHRDALMEAVRREVPGVSTALGFESLTLLIGCGRLGIRPPRRLARAPFAHVPIRLGSTPTLSARLIAMSHDIGLRVLAWTVDDAEIIRTLVADGIDAVVSDRPDVLREVFIELGHWRRMPGPGREHGPGREEPVSAGEVAPSVQGADAVLGDSVAAQRRAAAG